MSPDTGKSHIGDFLGEVVQFPELTSIVLVATVIIGVALAYCAVLTGSSLPGVAFHVLFSISGTLIDHSVLWDPATVGVIAIAMIADIMVLHKRLVKSGPAVTRTTA